MTGEKENRQTNSDAQSRRELLQTLGVAAVSAGAVATAGAGTAAAAADFRVRIVDAPEEIVAGQSAQLGVEVENVGDDSDTQRIRSNYGRGSVTVSLGAGQSTQVTIGIRTTERDAGNQLVEVYSVDDDDGVRIDMLEPPYFVAEIAETNGPVVEGRDVEVIVEITNTGEANGSTVMEWKAEEQGTFSQTIAEDETGVSANGGQTTTQTITFETEATGRREILVTAAGLDETDSVVVQMIEARPPIFEVEITEIGDVNEGGELDVTVDITNVGNAQGTKEVAFDLGDAGSTREELTVAEAETVTETFSVPTEHGSAGEQTLTVSTEDDEATGTVDIGQSAFFEAEILEHNSPVPGGFDLQFTIEVTNTGQIDGEQTVEVSVGDVSSQSQTVSLESGDSTILSFAVGTDSAEFDTYEATVDTGSEILTEEVEVAEVGYLEITDVTLNTPVTAGEEIEATVVVTNVGNRSELETLEAEIDGIDSGSTSINLEVDDSTEETFTFPTAEDNAGDHVLRVSTDSDSLSQNITIEQAESDDDSDSGGNGGDDSGVVDESDDEAPGFGIGAALSGLGGAGYLLKRRLNDDE